MSYRIGSLMSALFVCLILACGENQSNDEVTTSAGNTFTYVERNPDADMPEPGQYAFIHVQTKSQSDSVIMDSRTGGGEAVPVQVLNDTVVNEQTHPVEDVVRMLRLGERAVVPFDISDLPMQGRPPGTETDTVILFDIEVTEVLTEEEFTARQEERRAEQAAKAEAVRAREPEMLDFSQQVYEDYKAGELDGELQSTASGLRYIMHEEGSGEEAEPGRGVVVQYIGRLTENGEIFDQSFERGMGIPFPLGQGAVIPGWDEGIDLLQEGDRATFFVPSELAYGERGAGQGSIPPNSELMFYVELEEVQ